MGSSGWAARLRRLRRLWLWRLRRVWRLRPRLWRAGARLRHGSGLWRAGLRPRWLRGLWWIGYGGYGYGDPYYGGYGLSSWNYGPSLYDWGYASYYNPYSYGTYGTTTIVAQPVYNYTQPINTLAAPPDPGVSSQAITCFDSAREAFKAGNYARALELTDQAIRQMPNDAALHEFRRWPCSPCSSTTNRRPRSTPC